jgi:hypothetical protein
MKTRFVRTCLGFVLAPLLAAAAGADVVPPPGFVALYNGCNLSGWRGGDTFDHRKWLAMPSAERKQKAAEWNAGLLQHWHPAGDELVNDGNGPYATTERDYGDFELLIEYRTVARADSGVYLRGCPQVQIWDYTDPEKFARGGDKGSGGLWNNSPGAPGKDPLVKADRPFGEWNQLRILMVGARVSVWLNDQLTVDHALMENYFDRQTPIPSRGPIQLQTHGGEIRWRNIFLREIAAEEANEILARHGAPEAFARLFNGQDLTGWSGAREHYEVVDGAIVCRPGLGGTLYTDQSFADFTVRFEFRVPPGGNSGLAVRYPGSGDAAYDGLTEIQILAEDWEAVRQERLDPRQRHGSAYGMVAAAQGYQRPVGGWNFQEVTVRGSTVTVELNGTVILNADLATVSSFLDDKAHPGLARTSGAVGIAGHQDPVAVRALQIKRL